MSKYYILNNHVKTIVDHLGGKRGTSAITGLSPRTIRRYTNQGVTAKQYSRLLRAAIERAGLLSSVALRVKLLFVR